MLFSLVIFFSLIGFCERLYWKRPPLPSIHVWAPFCSQKPCSSHFDGVSEQIFPSHLVLTLCGRLRMKDPHTCQILDTKPMGCWRALSTSSTFHSEAKIVLQCLWQVQYQSESASPSTRGNLSSPNWTSNPTSNICYHKQLNNIKISLHLDSINVPRHICGKLFISCPIREDMNNS